MSDGKSINAEYINDDKDFDIISLMGSPTLIYGTERKKKWKGVAFKDTDTARKIANAIIGVADKLDGNYEG